MRRRSIYAAPLRCAAATAASDTLGGHGVMIRWHVERRACCVYSLLKRCSASEVAAI
jgi:TnpA family transposase